MNYKFIFALVLFGCLALVTARVNAQTYNMSCTVTSPNIACSGAEAAPSPSASPIPTAPPGNSAYPGFPIPLAQPIIFCNTQTSTSLTCAFKTPPASGDLLIAIVEYEVWQNTFSPPAGWTQLFDTTCFPVWYKVAGTDSGFNITQTTSTQVEIALLDFSGSHSINATNRTATITTKTAFWPAAPLTNPSGGIITIGGSGNYSGGPVFINSGLAANDWVTAYLFPNMNASTQATTTNGYDQASIGFWQGTVGINNLVYPTFMLGGQGGSQYNVGSGADICSETFAIQ